MEGVKVAQERPNIVIVHTHDTGRYLGCYGTQVATPNIDRLASEGVRFDRYFAPAPQCSPSRASMNTGLYPHRNGMMGLAHLGWGYRPGVATLPQLLARAGYDTYLFGTQHEASDPETLGYHHVFVSKMPQRAEMVAPAFAEFVRVRGKDRDARPFFASVGFWETHRPFSGGAYEPDPVDEIQVPPYLPDAPGVRSDLAQLHGMVKAADRGVGTIVAALDEAGLSEQTLLIYTTDHGIAFPRAKGTLYDSGLGIALVMRWPGHLPAGQVRPELLSNVDLFPTLLEAVGVPSEKGLDGRSFWSLARGCSGKGNDQVFGELTWHDRYYPMRAIRTDRWKYIRHFHKLPPVYLPVDIYVSSSGQQTRAQYALQSPVEEELYDLQADPLEQENLTGIPRYGEIARELRTRLLAWMEQTEDPLLQGDVPGQEAPEWENVRQNKPTQWT